MAKRGGSRRNAGRKPLWNSTENSVTIRVPESLADSLKIAKQVQIPIEQLIIAIDNVTNSVQLMSIENVTE